MGFAESQTPWLPPDARLDDELRAVWDDDRLLMINLFEDDTGVPGVIFVSTCVPRHGPRVKYYLSAGKDQPSFSVSIGPEPQVLANSLERRDLNRASPKLIAWVQANHEALAAFWRDGREFGRKQMNAFLDGLEKV